MKYIQLFVVVILVLLNTSFSIGQTKSSTLSNYFSTNDTGIQTGGVEVIPIETPKGRFNVWTKTFGNNPTIKLLLLNGGPGATHEYFECMESFFPKRRC